MSFNEYESEEEERYNRKRKRANEEFSDALLAITNATEKMSKLADEGATKLLLVLGALITLFSVVAKMKIFGYTFSDIKTIEFIFILVTGWLFLGVATLIRFLQYRDQQNMKKLIWEAGEKRINAINESRERTIQKIEANNETIVNTGKEIKL